MFPPFTVSLVFLVIWNGWFLVLLLPSVVFFLNIQTLPKSWVDSIKSYCLKPAAFPSFPGEMDPDTSSSAVKTLLVNYDVALFLLTNLCLLFQPTWIAPTVCSIGLAIVAPYATLDGEILAKEYNKTLATNSN